MCGLVAVFQFEKWGISYAGKEIFQQMLIADSIRGVDGTGVLAVTDKEKVRTLKVSGNPFNLIGAEKWKDFIDPKYGPIYSSTDPRDIILAGHNRYKTTGESTTAHAHPHVVGPITLIHNGTVQEYSKLPRFKNFEVDSQAVANSIDELGIQETIALYYGGYAMIYFDQRDSTINVCRNDKRPLSMAYDESNKRLFLASESLMLHWLLRRHISIQASVKVEEFPADKLFSWKLDSIIPKVEDLSGPKAMKHNIGNASWSEEVSTELVDYMEKKKGINPKKVHQRVTSLRKSGIPLEIVKEYAGLKKGDKVIFRVTDYADENPQEETFLIMGETQRLKETSFRFRLKGAAGLDALFEQPMVEGIISNIIHYPEGNDQNDKFVLWVKEPSVYIAPPKEQTKPGVKTDSFGREIHIPKYTGNTSTPELKLVGKD